MKFKIGYYNDLYSNQILNKIKIKIVIIFIVFFFYQTKSNEKDL